MPDKFITAILAGGISGLIVETTIFPIDTIKTRLQSEQRFWRAGGFKNIYRGLGPVAVTCGPASAIFFCTYETIKHHIGVLFPKYKESTYINVLSATVGEIVACSIKIPTEIMKMRRQVAIKNITSLQILWEAYKTEGLRKGLYRGYGVTLSREIPFSFIQFPLWEYFKLNWCKVTGFEELTSVSVAICGAAAGAIAAGITTPLDVAKTRIMLAKREVGSNKKLRIRNILMGLYRENGIKGIFIGFVPRVMLITLAGAIHFGFYDLSTRLINRHNSISD